MKVAVLGAGTMGNGIAQVFAQHGHAVVLRDLERPILDRALARIAASLAKLAEKGKLAPADKDAALDRIQAATALEAAAPADLVVEAVVERSDVCAVPAAGIVGEAMMAIVIADAFLEKFGGDGLEEVRRNHRAYQESLRSW